MSVTASDNPKVRAVFLTLGSSLLWGSSFVAVKVGLEHIDPVWFAFWRTLGAGLLLVAFSLNRGLLWYLRRGRIWALGLLNGAAFVLQNVGMQHTTASKAAFYVNLGFIGVAILSWLFLHESFGALQISSIILGLVGVTALATGFQPEAFHGGTILGDALVILAGLLWACYFVITKVLLHDPNVRIVPLTAVVLLVTGVLLLPISFALGDPTLGNARAAILILLYTTIFCSAIPLLMWTRGLRDLTPTASAVILLAEPVFGAAFGFALLGERFTSVEAFGAILILCAIALYSRAEAKQ